MFIDTHCHLTLEQFDSDREQVLERATSANVNKIIVPSVDLDDVRKVLVLCSRHPSVYAAVGVHPNYTPAKSDDWLDQISAAAANPRVVAIGEIGLDYYRDYSPATIQRTAFEAQLETAITLGLPVIIHNREASGDILDLYDQISEKGSLLQGVLHSFSGTWEVARRALKMGMYIGFTGPLTYRKADDLRQIASQVPLNRLLVETDAPYLAPQQHRGRRNEPSFVRFIAERLAELRGISLEQITEILAANTTSLFPGLGNRA